MPPPALVAALTSFVEKVFFGSKHSIQFIFISAYTFKKI
jgi:hypothetical protein